MAFFYGGLLQVTNLEQGRGRVVFCSFYGLILIIGVFMSWVRKGFRTNGWPYIGIVRFELNCKPNPIQTQSNIFRLGSEGLLYSNSSNSVSRKYQG